jgi:hypothetical protein
MLWAKTEARTSSKTFCSTARAASRKLAFKPEVIQDLPLLQLLFQLIHHLLLLFNDTDMHSKLLCLLDGTVGSGLD